MAKNFLEGVNLKAQNGRNGFDVGYQNQFTMPFGMILPHFFQRVNPDDKIKLANETQVICDGLVRPAFMRLRLHLDYYFIPATQLWMPFDNFVTGQNSYFSELVKQKNEGMTASEVPTFNLDWLNTAFQQWAVGNVKDDLGFDFRQGVVRLLDMLGYMNLTGIANNDFTELSDLGWNDKTQRYNLLPLLCYQKVYYDYFRNVKYEDNITGAYNIDDLKSGTVISDLGDVDFSRMTEIFKIHYRWQKRDYFTQTQPNVLVESSQIGYSGLGNEPNFSGMFRVPGLIGGSPALRTAPSTLNPGNFLRTGGVTGASSATLTNIQQYGVSVANIRFAFAYDKLLRRMREAGADFDAQMLAQFGITPFDARHGKCTYIGGYTNNLAAKDITNMTGEDIGELAGQINAYCDNQRTLKYHAKEHGYIIGVVSTSVENMYQSYRTSRETLLRNRYDWFNPAFENIGLQPLFEAERSYLGSSTSDYKSFEVNTYGNVIGYVPRYSELKTHVDECHGTLAVTTGVVGNQSWNVQLNHNSFGYTQVLQRSNLLLSPSMFDNVSGVEYDGKQTSDHFVVNLYNHSKKVSAMSVFEPF